MPLKRPRSKNLYKSMCKILPGGVNSPIRNCKAMEQEPMIVASASKDLLTDVDGHRYIDFCCSWGALIHGHAHPTILKAVQKRMALGSSYGISTPIEHELAKEAIKLVPSIKKIRFVSSGTEATMSALRLARGYTQKEYIIKFIGNYHGHADFLLVQAGSGVLGLTKNSSSAGIPEDAVKHTLNLPYNDVKALKQAFNDKRFKGNIAAVIIEPIAGNMGVIPATQEFIDTIREETQKEGAVLIFDEVITGFRVHLNGAQKYFGITPDLTCLGKIVGGGFPVAAFGGKEEIMNCLAPLGPVYQAGTLSGNPVAMEAGLQSLKLLQKPKFYKELENKARMIVDPLQEIIKKRKLNACINHVGSMFSPFFGVKSVNSMEDVHKLDKAMYVKLFQYLFENGVYAPPLANEAWFVSSEHSEKNLKKAKDLLVKFFNHV